MSWIWICLGRKFIANLWDHFVIARAVRRGDLCNPGNVEHRDLPNTAQGKCYGMARRQSFTKSKPKRVSMAEPPSWIIHAMVMWTQAVVHSQSGMLVGSAFETAGACVDA